MIARQLDEIQDTITVTLMDENSFAVKVDVTRRFIIGNFLRRTRCATVRFQGVYRRGEQANDFDRFPNHVKTVEMDVGTAVVGLSPARFDEIIAKVEARLNQEFPLAEVVLKDTHRISVTEQDLGKPLL